jgi:radical SAM protein with 4Fe4S-binding SPASM domain
MLNKNLQIYVKTTETCNLNCKHCFTSGSKGAKVYFDPFKTYFFLKKLVDEKKIESLRLLYHGGEPLLAPVKDLLKFYDLTQELDTEVSYAIQTNLVYNLTEDKLKFFDIFKSYGIGTSWDEGIRFGSSNPNDPELRNKHLSLWEDNVKKLVSQGHFLTLMVSLNSDIINNKEPYEIIEYASKLGIKYILFERITGNGNALENPDIFPRNRDVDKWLFRMYQQTLDRKLYLKIGNMFLNEIAYSFLKKQHMGNRCRNCELSLITINADGSLSGCPNSAPENKWGDISLDLDISLKNKNRIGAICKEMTRNPVCSTCPVNSVCNGDCYKLPWEGDICAAPKTLMQYIKDNKDFLNLENLILN